MDDYISMLNEEILEAYEFDDELMHYGVGPDNNPPGRGSGRYAKGSGENPNQHDLGLSGMVSDLKKKGMKESEIAEYLGFKNRKGEPSTSALRTQLSIEKARRELNLSKAVPEYKASGMSNVAIAEKLGISEASVRNYLNKDRKLQFDKATVVANDLKLKKEGYKVHLVNVEQMGNPGKYTTITVVGEPDTEWKTVVNNPDLIQPYTSYAVDNGETMLGLKPIKSIDSSRVKIRYAEEGGADRDGTIELRRGVDDISLGNSRYAQVRIGVDGTHYMKGMALYSDNIPDGYDVVYNSNKKLGTSKDEVFKPMKDNPDNPFGATIKRNVYNDEGHITAGGQSEYKDKDGNYQLRVINKVNDQGDWGEWSKTISAQVLAKQPMPLVKRQLELSYQDKLTEFEEYKNLNNPTIKKKMLEGFADDCDASAVHLKAKAFPGQASHVIIPITTLKGDDHYKKTHGVDGEVFAPNYPDGSTVALVRYPHAGTFEIPILRVNNKNREGIAIIGKNAPDAIGINAKIADRLSGADFDGDTVAVIPTTHTNIKSTPRLKELEGFNTKSYKFEDPNAPGIKPKTKQVEMGKVTNLIADMQIKGATEDEVARAVKHSMVVIDSEKHHLDYKQSAIDNNIQALKAKYQNGKGASTLITRAKSQERVDARKVGSYVDPVTGKKVYGVDPITGKKIYVDTGEEYTKTYTTKSGEERTKVIKSQEKSTKMAESDDARDLMTSRSNPYPVELAYANYANRLKDLARESRKEALNTPRLKRDPQAAKEYAAEVKDLNDKLVIALKNAPRERQAQIIANTTFKYQVERNPELKEDKDYLKRLRGQSLERARTLVGAKKKKVDITDREWEAIQKGAISDHRLRLILDNADQDKLKQRATPRDSRALNASLEALARNMATNGYSNAEIAERIGVSTSTVSKIINA